ncbi:response regulator transcription factor [Schleiferilactobacillus shenzhenensis]|uniref:GlnR n=1 Tax=Schleiferilactobacillus shenzhenensis LY-73 TaxID=1231336 RepID=U4TV84_9LACO|nr:response regulator transcription factor [Schleiferilactobacillus shenzhenensis]ERL65307.1 GlnR [Schleiferilactobacillus shenzhenensis LY-73]
MAYLIIEDEPVLRQTLAAYFQPQTAVTAVPDLAGATAAVQSRDYTVILLDLTLPDGDGLAWLQTWRPLLSAKIVVLTANDSERTTLAGLALADDYIVKPVSLRVLQARLAKLLPPAVLTFRGVRLDPAARTVTRAGQRISLSANEYRLLAYLFTHPNAILTRDQLLAAVWDIQDTFVEDNTLTVAIKRLRQKLEADPARPQLIKTVRGMGYFLNAEK